MHTLVLKYRLVWFFILVSNLILSCQKTDLKPPILVFAHAGMSLYEERSIYPANSFEAIQYSVDALGAEGVEIDVQMTKDSVLVLFHDSYITTSPYFSGCVSNYNWNILKELKHSNSNFNICKLDTVMDYLVSKKITMYLDLKPYDYCRSKNGPLDVFASEIDSIMNPYSLEERGFVIAGSLNRQLLQKLNTDYKCFESSDADYGIAVAEEDNYKYLMFSINVLDEEMIKTLIHSPFKWGVFGGKSNGEIRKTIALEPDCFISDNFVYTQEITK